MKGGKELGPIFSAMLSSSNNKDCSVKLFSVQPTGGVQSDIHRWARYTILRGPLSVVR
jgi:hypothetical protein